MFVSQKMIIINKEGKILDLRRSKTDPSRPLTWDLPGGQLDEGEPLEDNVRREIKEEAGIDVQDFSVLDAAAGMAAHDEYWVVIGYVAHVDMPPVTLSYEHDQYKWLTKEEFLQPESSEKIKKFLSKLDLDAHGKN